MKTKITLSLNSIYYGCLFVWTITAVLASSLIGNITSGMYYFNLLVIYGSAILVGYRFFRCIVCRDVRTKICVILLVLCAILGTLNSGRQELLIVSIFVIGAIDVDIKKAVLWLFRGNIIGISIVVILCMTGVIEGVQSLVERNGVFVQRYAMGFSHSNVFAALLLQTVTCALFLKKKRMTILSNILIFAMGYVIYLITYSRTTFLVLAGIALYNTMGIISRKVSNNRFWRFMSYNVARGLVIGGALISLYIAVSYDSGSSLIELITSIESARPMLLAQAMAFYPITPFGQEVNLISSNSIYGVTGAYAVLDNAYIYLLLVYGIVNAVWLLVLYLSGIRSIRNSGMTEDKKELVVLIMIGWMLSAMTEKYAFNLLYNFTLLIIPLTLYGHSSDRR